MSHYKKARIIPCLLLKNTGLVKTTKFKDPRYLGDPRNAVKIFNDKEADELVLLDITATLAGAPPKFDLIAEIASECFMPLAYGGGIRTVDEVQRLIGIGIEKVVINSAAVSNPQLIEAAARVIGSQSVVASIDVRQSFISRRYEVFTHSGTKGTRLDPVAFARQMESAGAGEIFLNSIDRDGLMKGYDIDLVSKVAQAVRVPVVACGGAGTVRDLAEVVRAGASAASAGSMFVFQGKLKAVLISFPLPQELTQAFSDLNIE